MEKSTALGIGLLAVVGVGAYVYLKRKKSTTTTTTTTTTSSSAVDSSLGLPAVTTTSVVDTATVAINTTREQAYRIPQLSMRFCESSEVEQPPEEFVDAFPDYARIEKMCKEYPGLAIAFEKFKTTYKLVKDHYDTPADQRPKP